MNRAEHLPSADYERSDAAPAAILVTGAFLVLGLGVVLAVSGAFYQVHTGLAPIRNRAAAVDFAGGPDERTGIAVDWVEQDRLVREHLATYGWIDRPAGIVRIPVDRALELVAAESTARSPEAKKP